MEPKTCIRSAMMRLLASQGYLALTRRRARLQRMISREPQAVHYFHQVDDPYSHLAVQKLDALRASYNLPFQICLVTGAGAAFQGSSEHYERWALRDALSVADAYGTTLPATGMPGQEAVAAANNALAPLLDDAGFASAAVAVGEALWSGTLSPAQHTGTAGSEATARGDTLRAKLGHYQGGMFYFDGEWFWGIDRIRLLEARLIEEGLGRGPVLVPEPTATDTSALGAGHIVLEYFPSLRSPYTAVGHQRVLDLIERSGVTVRLRPVMPMMMRGIPAPRAKQRYIITDAAREARARGVPFGRVVDPFGEPVKRAFALFPGAVALGKGMDFVTAYLAGAWAAGIDIATDSGLQQVAAAAGINWKALGKAADGEDWEALLEENLQAMLAAGLWGVPSFRISGGRIAESFACWGQDRIWRVENEIARRA